MKGGRMPCVKAFGGRGSAHARVGCANLGPA
jgi:hypothetical protein